MFVGLGLLQVYQSFEVEVLVFHINMEKEQGKLNMNLFGHDALRHSSQTRYRGIALDDLLKTFVVFSVCQWDVQMLLRSVPHYQQEVHLEGALLD